MRPLKTTRSLPSLSAVVLVFFFLASILSIFPRAGYCADTGNYISKHLAVYGDSPLIRRYANRIAREYRILITEWWKYKEVWELKALNPRITVLFYRDLIGIRTDYDDWAEVRRHDDWFVRDTRTGKRVRHNSFGWYLMDLTNKGYRNHLLEYIQGKFTRFGEFDGVFLDDVPEKVSPRKFFIEGEGPGNRPRFNAHFQDRYYSCVSVFLKKLKDRLGAKLLFINSDERGEFLDSIDGIMFEGFVHGSWQDQGYRPTLSEWREEVADLRGLTKTGKTILVHCGSRGNRVEVRGPFIFSLASYLLYADEKTLYSFDVPSMDGELPFFEEYEMETGQPAGPPTITGRSQAPLDPGHIMLDPGRGIVIRRDFEKASVFVNPTRFHCRVPVKAIPNHQGDLHSLKISIPPKSAVIISR
ncbi:MAG: hypothetical protein JRJ78_09855 [Deltaproteobacteria bacterium]|nr:hypothetical protein [Deltaproteobacteria bacterium]